MRRLLLVAAVSMGALALPAGAAVAEEVPPEVRLWVERAFLEGRPEDVDRILEDQPRDDITYWWPRLVRDRWWRLSEPGGNPPLVPAARGFDRRLAWLAGEGEPPHRFPDVDGGGEDPYPILTALIRDRERRETRGHLGLPEESPLLLLSPIYDPRTHEWFHYLLGENTRRWMALAYHAAEETQEDRAMKRAAERVKARNGRWAVWALVLFILLPILGSLWLGRRTG